MDSKTLDPKSQRIEALLDGLKLPTIKRLYRKIAQEIADSERDPQSYLLALLEEEFQVRQAKRIQDRLKEASFPQIKLLSSLDFDAPPIPPKEQLQSLANCEYIAEGKNILAIGNSGTGKSHVAIGLGVEACRKNLKVRFYSAVTLASELEAAKEGKELHRYLKRFGSFDLVILDEVGYLPLSKTGAELLFQAVSERHERRSLILTSNLPFEEWTEIFYTKRLAAALLDRLTHRSIILQMNGPSYRLKETLKAKETKKEAHTKVTLDQGHLLTEEIPAPLK